MYTDMNMKAFYRHLLDYNFNVDMLTHDEENNTVIIDIPLGSFTIDEYQNVTFKTSLDLTHDQRALVKSTTRMLKEFIFSFEAINNENQSH